MKEDLKDFLNNLFNEKEDLSFSHIQRCSKCPLHILYITERGARGKELVQKMVSLLCFSNGFSECSTLKAARRI